MPLKNPFNNYGKLYMRLREKNQQRFKFLLNSGESGVRYAYSNYCNSALLVFCCSRLSSNYMIELRVDC